MVSEKVFWSQIKEAKRESTGMSLVLLSFDILHFTDVVSFAKKGKIFHQQNKCDSLYWGTPSIAVVWNPTGNVSEVCLWASQG